jgi:hypothetical protein
MGMNYTRAKGNMSRNDKKTRRQEERLRLIWTRKFWSWS